MAHGGLVHIFSVLTQHGATLDPAAVSMLLKLASTFLLNKAGDEVNLQLAAQAKVDMAVLVATLLRIVWDAARRSLVEPASEPAKLGGNLLVASLFSVPSLLEVVYRMEHADEFLKAILLITPDSSIRSELKCGISLLCSYLSADALTHNADGTPLPAPVRHPASFFCQHLLELLDFAVATPDAQTCDHYFQLLIELVGHQVRGGICMMKSN